MGVFIAIPCSNYARYSSFWATLQELERPADSPVQLKVGPFIVNNQNGLGRSFLASGHEWFFLLNDDQIYPRHTLNQLLAHGKEAVCVVALNRRPPHQPLLYDFLPEVGHFVQRRLADGEKGLIPVDGAGGGGLLLHRSVFEKVPAPWWEVKPFPNGDHGGEDLEFCRKMKDAGIQLWCDLESPVGHVGDFAITPVRTEDGKWQIALNRTNA